MSKFRRILAPTDLSPESLSAVKYAARLARVDGAKLTVLHVPHATTLLFSDFSPPIDMTDIDRQIEEAAFDTLSSWCKRHLKATENVDVTMGRGVTHEAICQAAEKTKANVIVMATHGRKGVRHALLGSVTERVLRDSPCPVLVVRPPEKASTRRKPPQKKR